MKKMLIAILTFAMLFSMGISQTAFAAEPYQEAEDITNAVSDDTGVQPINTISGYGSHWYNSGENTSGSFTVDVTGTYAPTGWLTFRIQNFDSKVCVVMELYHPDGSLAWGTLSNAGGYLTLSDPDVEGQAFIGGQVGTYTVKYWIFNTDGSTPASGRMMCWIF